MNVNGSNHCGRICWIIVECRLNKCCLRSTMRAVCVPCASVCATSSSQVDPRTALRILYEQLLLLSCKLVLNWFPVWLYYPSSMYIEQSCCTRGSSTCTWSTELCHVIGVKIWVNICPPSFLIVRPMREFPRPVTSAVLSIRTFFALKSEICWNI